MKLKSTVIAVSLATAVFGGAPKADAYALPSALDLCNWGQLDAKTCAQLYPEYIDPATGLPWRVVYAAQVAARKYAKCQRIDRSRWYKRVQGGKAPRNDKQRRLLRWAAKNC